MDKNLVEALKKNDRILAMAPAYNEAGKIGTVVCGLLAQPMVDAVLVVDDGSTDATAEESRKAGAQVITQKKNSGVGAAIRSGLDYAKANGYTIFVVMGGDDQDNPDEINRLLLPLLTDHFMFVQGSRYMPGGVRVNIPIFRRVTTSLFSIFLRSLLRFPVTDGTNGYRALRLAMLDHPSINLHQDWLGKYELEPYLYYKAIECGFNVTEVPVTKRYPKEKKIGYTKMVPFVSWWSILKPLIYLRLSIKR